MDFEIQFVESHPVLEVAVEAVRLLNKQDAAGLILSHERGGVGTAYGLCIGLADGSLWPANPSATLALIGTGASTTYRIICTPFWAWCFTPGVHTVQRTNWLFHVPWIPPHITVPQPRPSW